MTSNSSGAFHFRATQILLAIFLATTSLLAAEDSPRWWPTQAMPRAILRVPNPPSLDRQMMLQSLAGLAAKNVNAGRCDTLVWVDDHNPNLEEWLTRLRAAHPELQDAGTNNLWQLADRLTQQGIVKGYILYRSDKSVNVATSLAGILDGILISEDLEPQAKKHGLKLLFDARDKSDSWCFETCKDHFNRRLLCMQDPKKPHARDLAIAQQAFTFYDDDHLAPTVVNWLEPLSPILGWNAGDEFKNTDLLTRYGDFQTDTDWSINLPVLMAGTESFDSPRMKSLDPATINWQDTRDAVSFVETDGDNVQWLLGNFFLNNTNYWRDPTRGKIPFGWSCCFAQLSQLGPEALAYAAATRTTNDSLIEMGGGYFYPDHFGMNRPNRWELLARHTQRTWHWMKETNTRIIGFDVAQLDSPDARKAYETIAAQTDGLLAIFAFQYYPYEGGAGRIFWVKDRNGLDVPVITARYSIWEHSNERDRSGTPAKVAREIQQTAAKSLPAQSPRYDWVICHAWSYFKKSPGPDEDAENMPQENAPAQGGVRGYLPVTWCADRLPTTIRVVAPEELAWRIRMQHNPAQTKQFMATFQSR